MPIPDTVAPTEPTDDLLDDLIRAGNPSHVIKRVAKLMAEVDALNERRAKDAARKAEKRAQDASVSADIHGQRGQARTSSSRAGARAESLITNSSVPSQENKKEKKQTEAGNGASAPVSVLETVLDPDRAKAVVEHRSRMGKGKALTENSARLLASRLAACPDPNAAADEMIVRGWMSIKPDWLQDRERPSTGPPRQASNGLAAYARKRFGLNGNHANGTPSRPASEPPHSGPTLDLGAAAVPEPGVTRPALAAPQPRPNWPTRQ